MTGVFLSMAGLVLNMTGFDDDDDADESNEMAHIYLLNVIKDLY